MKKIFETRTLYIKDGEHLEEVRDFLFKNGESPLMGYVAEDYKDIPASQGFLFFDEDRWCISMKNTGKKEVITLDELKQLELDRLRRVLQWWDDYAECVPHRVNDIACEFADEKEAERNL